jgi:hypothetical protein
LQAFEPGSVPAARLGGGLVGALQKPKQRGVRIGSVFDVLVREGELAEVKLVGRLCRLYR